MNNHGFIGIRDEAKCNEDCEDCKDMKRIISNHKDLCQAMEDLLFQISIFEHKYRNLMSEDYIIAIEKVHSKLSLICKGNRLSPTAL